MSGMTLNVDENLVKPIIEKEIEMAIVRELGKVSDLIPQLVRGVLNGKVGTDGKPSTYSSDRDRTYIDFLFQEAIKSATKVAVFKYIEENKATLEKEVEKQIKSSSSAISKSMVKSLASLAENVWRFNLEVVMPKE
jgi:hypothetical protein